MCFRSSATTKEEILFLTNGLLWLLFVSFKYFINPASFIDMSNAHKLFTAPIINDQILVPWIPFICHLCSARFCHPVAVWFVSIPHCFDFRVCFMFLDILTGRLPHVFHFFVSVFSYILFCVVCLLYGDWGRDWNPFFVEYDLSDRSDRSSYAPAVVRSIPAVSVCRLIEAPVTPRILLSS